MLSFITMLLFSLETTEAAHDLKKGVTEIKSELVNTSTATNLYELFD